MNFSKQKFPYPSVWYNCHICKHLCYDTSDKLAIHYKQIHKKFNIHWKHNRLILKRSTVKLETRFSTLGLEGQRPCIKRSSPHVSRNIDNTCTKCGQTFHTVTGLRKHLQNTICTRLTGHKFTCQFCDKEFNSMFELDRHTRIHTGEKPFKCYFCQKSFKQNGAMRIHLLNHTGEKPFECTYCRKRFRTSYPAKIHMRGHTGQVIFECESPRSIAQKFTCGFCDKEFDNMCKLDVHTRVHTGERPFKCYFCHAPFKQKGTLGTHLLTHTGEKPFQCTYCKKQFRTSYQVKIHMRGHTGQGILECEICNKNYLTSNSFNLHMRSHLDIRMFKCDICHQGFNQRGHWKIHVENVHRDKLRPYKCTICSETFHLRKDLELHLKQIHPTARNYSCPYTNCTKTFIKIGHLRRHEKYHTGKGLHKCPYCPKISSCKSKLLDHERRIHTNNPENKCSECSTIFPTKASLRSHIRVHRNNDKYPCDQCDAKFRVIKALRRHIGQEHSCRVRRSKKLKPKKRIGVRRKYIHRPLTNQNTEVKNSSNHFANKDSSTNGKNIALDSTIPIEEKSALPLCTNVPTQNIDTIEKFKIILKPTETVQRVVRKSAEAARRKIFDDFNASSLQLTSSSTEIPTADECPALLKRQSPTHHRINLHTKKALETLKTELENQNNDTVKYPRRSGSRKFKTPRYCQKCGDKFTTYSGWYYHQTRACKFSKYKLNKPKGYECCYCQMLFPLLGLLQNHKKQIHPELIVKRFSCDFCNVRFISRSKLKTHTKIHQEREALPCNVCAKVFKSKHLLRRHLDIHENPEKFKCSFCSKGFSRTDQLTSHLLIHTGDKNYKCFMCSKTFAHLGSLTSHVNIHHTKEKPHECKFCKERFNSFISLKTHCTRYHSEDPRPYKCSICPKTCPSYAALRYHRITHSGNKPYQCHLCQYKSYRNSTLQNHLKEVHLLKGEKKFVCPTCGKKFWNSSRLKVHAQTHSNIKYDCPFCNKKFSYKYSIWKHMRSHTLEKPYKCSFCKKSFSGFISKKHHEMVHQGILNFKCGFCDKAYTQKVNLFSHIKKIHIHESELSIKK